MIPSYVTHYHLKDVPPFQTISDLTFSEWAELHVDLLKRYEGDPSYNRRFGLKYYDVRAEAESILREKFKAKGGKVMRTNPHYLCLGSSNWWKGFCDHEEIKIPLDQIDSDLISFTFPDSFTSMGVLHRFGIKHNQMPYHGKVYQLHELKGLIEEFGMPNDYLENDFSEYQNDDLEIYLEAQLWSDEPIRSHLNKFG